MTAAWGAEPPRSDAAAHPVAWPPGDRVSPPPGPGGWEQEIPVVIGDWRPAIYTEQLHRIAAAPVLVFGGQEIARTYCEQSAYTDVRARGGVAVWGYWPRCEDCRATEVY